MGTHPIFESDFDCLTDESISWNKAVYATRKYVLQKMWGQKKLTEKQYFAMQYRHACLKATLGWFLWSVMIFNDKWDSVAFLVKSGKTPQLFPDVPVKELHWTPFGWFAMG